jgi:hypothetical protein
MPAAHDHVPAQPAGPDPKRNGLQQDDASGEDRLPPKPAVALAVVAPAHQANRIPGRSVRGERYDGRMNPVAALTRKGATPGQAATVVYGLPLLILATLGLLLLDRRSGEAALVVLAASAPRALLCMAARWGESGEGSVIPELPEWRAVQFSR